MEDVGTGGKARLLGGNDLFLFVNFNNLGSLLSDVLLSGEPLLVAEQPVMPPLSLFALKWKIFEIVFLIFLILVLPPPLYSSRGCDNLVHKILSFRLTECNTLSNVIGKNW